MRYSEVRPQMQLGDVLLFEGNGRTSELIKRGQVLAGHAVGCAKYSHVAMVVVDPADKRVRCWESTTLSKTPDIYTDRLESGVQVTYLSQRVFGYDGLVWRRPVLVNRSADLWGAYVKVREELHGRPYEGNRLELAKAALKNWAGNHVENLSTVFCSELLTETHQRFGWYDDRQPSNSMSPAAWANEQPFGSRVPLGRAVLLEVG